MVGLLPYVIQPSSCARPFVPGPLSTVVQCERISGLPEVSDRAGVGGQRAMTAANAEFVCYSYKGCIRVVHRDTGANSHIKLANMPCQGAPQVSGCQQGGGECGVGRSDPPGRWHGPETSMCGVARGDLYPIDGGAPRREQQDVEVCLEGRCFLQAEFHDSCGFVGARAAVCLESCSEMGCRRSS